MADEIKTHEALNDLVENLDHISHLIHAFLVVNEHRPNAQAEIDYIYMVSGYLEEAQELAVQACKGWVHDTKTE